MSSGPARQDASADRAAPQTGAPAAIGAMREAFDRAWAERPDERRDAHYMFAGRPVRARMVGGQMARRFASAFEHLRVPGQVSGPDRLCLDLWDESVAGVPRPGPADLGGPTYDFEFGTFRSSPDGRIVSYERGNVLAALDRESGCIVGACGSGAGLRTDQRAKPLAALLSIWYNDRGVMLVHGGVVARQGRGLLLAGCTGAGKSTAALACLLAGYDFLGDDYLGVEATGAGRFIAHSMFSSVRLSPGHLARFPSLARRAIESDDPAEEKSLVFLSDASPERVGRSSPLVALASPRVVDSQSTDLSPISKGKALLRLAYSTILLPYGAGDAMERLAALVDAVPCYWLDLGRDLAQIPVRVGDLLDLAGEGGRGD